MKIIVVGASGTIGKAVCERLGARHEIITVGQSSGDHQLDMGDEAQVKQLFTKVGNFDALIVTAGKVHFGELEAFTAEQWQVGLQNKLMGQVNLVMHGLANLNEGGSFTLTSGILNQDPIRYGASAAMVNGALDSFVKAAAMELPKSARINIVSPTMLQESADKYEAFFRGYKPVPAADVALAYEKSVEGIQTGRVYTVGF